MTTMTQWRNDADNNADTGEDDAVVFFVIVVVDNDNNGDNANDNADAREDDALLIGVPLSILLEAANNIVDVIVIVVHILDR